MDLSIVVVSFNTKKLTVSCLGSIVASRPKLKYEIIVVDNASIDGTVNAIRGTKYEIRIIKNRENLGFAKANNQAIRKARGKYILLLNSDTKVKKGAIDKLYNFAKKTPDAGVTVPRLLNLDGSVQASVFKLPTLSRVVEHYWLGHKESLEKYTPQTGDPVKVEAAVMAAFLITPKALTKVGKLDERYFMYFEDLDYCRKVRAAGLSIYYLPTAEVVHLHGASGGNVEMLKRSSKVYHGFFKYYLIWFIMWTGQKLGR